MLSKAFTDYRGQKKMSDELHRGSNVITDPLTERMGIWIEQKQQTSGSENMYCQEPREENYVCFPK